MKPLVFTFVTLLFLGSLSLNAQIETRQYHTQKAAAVPRINGVLDEPVWQNADWTGDFTQFDPQNGGTPSQKTAFAILYDNNNLYIGIKCFDSEPDKIERRLTRRDGWEGDMVGVHLDSYFDKRTAFLFIVNAAGVKNDGAMSNDNNESFDDSWDPIWEVKTQINAEGWVAEMKIPLSQLRFGEKENQVWGLQMVRHVFRKDEWNVWQHIDNEAPGWVSLYGEMHGMNNIKPKKQIELAPFVVASTATYEAEEGNPFEDGSDQVLNAGLDAKIGLTNDLILDVAINPDFGQVEADPSVVNLSAFENFFAERRPFFIEGKNITDFRITLGGSPWARDQLFYSRRLGRPPSGSIDLADNEFADISANTRILGAFKLTGKTQKGWSAGIIESIANKESATIDNQGTRREKTIEPLSNYLVARLQKDINNGNTIIGGMFTHTYRDIKDPDLLFLPKTAISGGLDFTQFFQNRKYYLVSNIIFSHAKGDKEAITNLQESSRRFFQRPDADYIDYNPDLTSLAGTGGAIAFGKGGNSGLRFLTSVTWRSPGLELNDAGFLRRADGVFQFAWAGYQINKPLGVFRSMGLNVNQWAGWDFGGTNLFRGYNFDVNAQFTNFWSINGGIRRHTKGLSNTELRGGPSIIDEGRWNFRFNINSNSRKKLRVGVGGGGNKGDSNSSDRFRVWGDINYRPINSLAFSIAGNYFDNQTVLQYVDNPEADGENQYLFATINQKTFNLTIKVDYSITPNLSVQYYGAPFISGGAYSDFKKITTPLADVFNDRFYQFADSELNYDQEEEVFQVNEKLNPNSVYSFDKPDFNFRQFRSNLVMRWEYIPGSILFLVWSKSKTDDVSDGRFNLPDDWSALSSTKGRNVFLLKFSYRFRAEQWGK